MSDTPRDGNWIDEWGACKVCDGEIPSGHTERCDIYKLERELTEAKHAYRQLQESDNLLYKRMEVAEAERDQLRKVVSDVADETQSMIDYCNGDIMYGVTDIRFLKARCLENLKHINSLPHVQERNTK